MSFENERRAIEQRFAVGFSTILSTVTTDRIKWEDAAFNQPDDKAWVALKIVADPLAERISLTTAAPLQRHTGQIEVRIFVPEDQGSRDARVIGDAVELVYRNQRLSHASSGTITCGAATYQTIGVTDGWWEALVTIPYVRDKEA